MMREIFSIHTYFIIHIAIAISYLFAWLMMTIPVMSQRINQIRSRNRLAYPVLPPAAFHQIVEQQGDNVIGLKECAVLIDDPKPVCVSIRRDPNVGFVDPHLLP